MVDDHPSQNRPLTRRRLLSTTGVALAGSIAVAGCLGGDDDDGNGEADTGIDLESGPGVTSEGTSWEDLPDLEGTLEVYSGRREAQIDEVFRKLEDFYDDELEIVNHYDDNEAHLQLIQQEGDSSPADILYTQDSGTLGMLNEMGRTVELTDDVIETVPEHWRDPDGNWTGVSGRTRCVAYNTDEWDAEDLPDSIFDYPSDERFEDEMGWRVDSGSFRAFVQAMLIEHGKADTRAFLEDMDAAGIEHNEGGSTTPEAIANGELSIGFVNQYYVGRLIAQDPDLPIGVTFTDGDVGSLFNVSGAAVLDSSDNQDLARGFIMHLLGTEGQEFFVDTNKEYAVIDGIDYVGDLPTLEEINAPEFDLNQLSDIQPAVDLLQETGIY